MSVFVSCVCGRQIEAPDADAGRCVCCPDCRRELTIAGPSPQPEPAKGPVPSHPELTVTSAKAIASLALGAFFIFACLSGLPAILLGWSALSDIRKSGGRITGQRMAVAGIVLGLIGCLFTAGFFMPAMRSADEAARRSMCAINLKQIGLAIDNYEKANGYLPPAAIINKSGRPLLSWRVAILPHLELTGLYSKFHLDEPWDSPHNLTLLDPMPPVFACPSDRTRKPTMTGYQSVIGPDTAFTPDLKLLRYQDFTDGINNTLLVGESRHSVPWTKPEDLPFDLIVPLTGLGSYHGYHHNGFNVLFADGSVRFIQNSIAPSVLDGILTRNGGRPLPE